MTGGQRDELVEARADAILASAHTAEAYAEHFEAQMHAGEFEAEMDRGKVRKLLAPLRVFRRPGVTLLAVILAACALLGYAASAAGMGPVLLYGANVLAAVNMAAERAGSGAPGTGLRVICEGPGGPIAFPRGCFAVS